MRMRKGFLYAVEGIIAALIIFGYVGQFLSLPIQRTDWNQALLKQQSREFLAALDSANLTSLIVENRQSELSGVLSFFLGETRGFSVTTQGLFKPTISVGVWVNGSDVITLPLATAANCEGKQSDPISLCLTNIIDVPSKFPVRFLVVDNDTNFLRDFESVWIDIDKNGVFNEPASLVANQLFTIGETTYAIGNIPANGSYIVFYNATLARQLADKIQPFTLNGRRVNFAFTAASASSDLNAFDALIFQDYKNLSGNFAQLATFLDRGKGLLEIVDFTSAAQIDADAVQSELFGLAWTGQVCPLGVCNYVLNAIQSSFETAELSKFFSAIPNRVDTFAISPKDATNKLVATGENLGTITSADGNYHYGFYSNGRLNYTFLVVNSSTIYDRTYVDTDRDGDFADETARLAGSSVTFGGNTFTVKSISPDGNFVDLNPSARYTFANLGGRNVGLNMTDATQLIFVNATPNTFAALGNIRPTGGRAAWVVPGLRGDDELALLRALLVWVSDKKHEIVRERLLQSSASTSAVLFSTLDFFQPFTIFLRVWYSV